MPDANEAEFLESDGQPDAEGRWELRLYVAGRTPKSVAAFVNLKRICEEYMQGRYHVEVIDLLEQPQLAKGDQIFAVPHAGPPTASAAEKNYRGFVERRAGTGRLGPATGEHRIWEVIGG